MNCSWLQKNIRKLRSHFLFPIHIKSNIKPKRGAVLLSYICSPFFMDNNNDFSGMHTNYWECRCMVKTFLDLGYDVDVINWWNNKFVPKKKYDIFVDIHSNLERWKMIFPKSVFVLHVTGSHWLFQNKAEYCRLSDLTKRRGVVLFPKRIVMPCYGIESADAVSVLGNNFTIDTFKYAGKKLHQLSLATELFDFPYKKDFQKCSKTFLWFGGSGLVHKGLDLILEIFSENPDWNLIVCGPISNEKDFEKIYYKELYQTKNIKTLGWIKVGGKEFINIINNCSAVIFASCSEGQAGSVVSCMQAGLVPIISKETGVDVVDFGFIFNDNSKHEIQNTIQLFVALDSNEKEIRSRKSFEYARKYHSRDAFSESYKNFIINAVIPLCK